MLQYDWDNSVGYWLAAAAHAVRRSLSAELAAHGITLRQWEVLAWTTIEGDLSQAELAERMGIEAPTLVGILDRMERDGWLDRYSCPDDRRKKKLRVTDKAAGVWLRMANCARSVRARAIDGFSPDEVSQLKHLCDRIRDNLSDSRLAGRDDTSAEPGRAVDALDVCPQAAMAEVERPGVAVVPVELAVPNSEVGERMKADARERGRGE